MGGVSVDKSSFRLAGMVAAAYIGLSLSSGYGIASADPSAPDPSGAGASSDAGAAASASRPIHRSAGSPSARSGAADADEDGTTKTTTLTKAKGASEDEDAPARGHDHHHRSGAAGTRPEPAKTRSHPPVDDETSAGGTLPVAPVTDGATVESDSAGAVSSASGPAVGAPTSVEPSPVVTAPTQAAATTVTPDPAGSVVTTPVALVAKFLGALALPGAPTPVESPPLWGVLAWVRREFAATVSPSAAGQVATVSTATAGGARALAATTTTIVDITDYGAVGDGVTDDSAAIKAAQAALTSGDTLYIPPGDYRFAQQHPAGNAAILLEGLSNVTVDFAPGARLLMDNLDANGYGTSHGIRVEGAASNVAILNPTIEWVTRPSARSFGDGISVLGWPSDTPPPAGWTGSTGTVQFVSIVNGRVVNAPQTGAVIMGASDVTVTNFTAIGTLADGLHFNADRRVTVDGLVALNTGDDGLAFVTYYDASQTWTYGPTDGPFNQAGLGEWNNGGSMASHISVTGGRANGVRVQGGYDITISDVTVNGKDNGIQVNSAMATAPGDWTSLASRDIDISDVTISGAQTGIVLATNNIDGTEDSRWWDFSGVSISDVTIHGSKNWSLAVETPGTTTSKLAGVTLRNIDADAYDVDGPYTGGNGGILLASLHDSVIDNVHLESDHAADINVLGAGQLRGGVAVEDLPSSNLEVNDLVLQGPGRILIQDIAGVQFGNVASYGAQGSAVVLFRVKDATFDDVISYLPGRGSGDARGVQILQVYDVDIANIEVTTDDHVGSSWWAIELGGGNPNQIAGAGVRVENVTYVSGRDDTSSDIVVQGGPYGPVDWYVNAHWLHEGEASPQWRSALYGDTSPL